MTASPARTGSPRSDALRGIQAPVGERLEDVVVEMRRILTSDLPNVEAVSGHLLRMRGKLFRPTLALLASGAEGTPEPRATTLAASIELMHLATLVHDDSVDHSNLRRGLPTINALFSHQVSVIMGDFLYSRALIALTRMGDIDVLRVLTEVSNLLSTGEMLQLGAIDALAFTEDQYYQLIHAKTASLLSASCETGAMCGAARFREPLARYGDRLGMAFQIADDILDYTEDESVTGKTSGSDLREHKVTLPLIASLPAVTPAARARIDELFAMDEPDDRVIADVVGIVGDAGGIEEARRRGARFADEAEAALATLPESAIRSALTDAIGYVMDRRW